MSTIGRRALDVVRGKRYYSFYFSTVSMTDALSALGLAVAALLRLPVVNGARARLAEAVRERYGGEVFLYGSARSALFDHLCALALPAGAEVVVTGFTCEVVANAVIHAGLRPVYADIDRRTYCMDPASLRRVITEDTAVLIVQHSFGISAPMDELMQVARENDLHIIEDCAVALGTTHGGRLAGTFGDAAIFSLELSKTITSCRGGMLVLHRSDRLLEQQRTRYEDVPEPTPREAASVLFQLGASGLLYRPRLYPLGELVAGVLMKVGLFRPSTAEVESEGGRPPGYLVRLSAGQAAVVSRQWRRLPEIVRHARSLAARYDEAFQRMGGQASVPVSTEASPVRYPLRSARRDLLRDRLQERGVELGYWFTAPLSTPAVDHRRLGYVDGACPVAQEVAGDVFNLPTHTRITEELSRTIIEVTESVVGETLP